MKRYLSTFAVGLILYAVPGYSQTAQFKDSIPKRSTTNAAPASPGFAAEPNAPPLNYCMIEIQTSNLKGVKSAEEWSSGCERRVDIYCKTHDTGDEDDTPANRERDHMLSACNHLPSPAACKRAFREMCSALASWQATNP
jgi:hypothetical protein